MLSTVFAELVGSFIFMLTILNIGEPIAIVIALLAVIYAFQHVSLTNFNPMISTVLFIKGDLSMVEYLIYVISQIIGGLCALMFYTYSGLMKK